MSHPKGEAGVRVAKAAQQPLDTQYGRGSIVRRLVTLLTHPCPHVFCQEGAEEAAMLKAQLGAGSRGDADLQQQIWALHKQVARLQVHMSPSHHCAFEVQFASDWLRRG